MINIAESLFCASYAESQLEDILIGCGLKDWEKLSWDHYDSSLEIYGVDAAFRFSDTKKIFQAGFDIIFVNHVDGWETQYNKNGEDGWRVCHLNKRTPQEYGILVEKFPTSWPKEWLETGYVKIVQNDHLQKDE